MAQCDKAEIICGKIQSSLNKMEKRVNGRYVVLNNRAQR